MFYDIQQSGQLWEVSLRYQSNRADFDNLVSACKILGAEWRAASKKWYIASSKMASILQHANVFAKTSEQVLDVVRNKKMELDGAAKMDLSDPDALTPLRMRERGKAIMPHQIEAIKFIAERESTLLADSMGCGKSIVAVGCLNACPDFKKALIICPANLKQNWFNELKDWMVDTSRSIGIVSGSYWPPTDVVIINYDVLDRHKGKLDAITWDFIFQDECHYIKSTKAKRTKAIIGGKIRKKKRGK